MSESGSVSDESSSRVESSTNTQTESGKTSTSSSSFSLARSETRRIIRNKRILLGFILLAAGAIGYLTFNFVRKEEQDDFEASFSDFATELADLIHFEAQNVYDAVASLGTTITSYTLATQASWPNVTIPHFELRGQNNNKLSKALQTSFVPLINKNDLLGWEAYSRQQQGWITEGVELRNEQQGLESDLLIETITPYLWVYDNHEYPDTSYKVRQMGDGVDFGPAEYAAVWQQSPAPSDPKIINYDLLSHPVFKRVYHGLWETRLPVLSEIMNVGFIHNGAVVDDETHPHSILLHPVYDFFSTELHDRDDIRGMLMAVLPWDSYFSDLMPESVKGIDVVLHNTCGEYHTYSINGREATYLGDTDLHDLKFNYLGVETEFAPFLLHNFSDAYEHCEYDLRIYPSQSFQDQYLTVKPYIYMAGIVLVFLFTAVVFISYDMAVQRRQDKVMASAKRTNAIVSSLFPANVRDRILKDAKEQAELDIKNNRRSVFNLGGKTQLKNFLDEDENAVGTNDESKPIADFFPETTVMFGDIVGFTAWSSVREPAQVFTLLETLYAAFDEIARRRRVFKVETVGDCYVAVTGLPDPRKDHAVVMARFARDCLTRMNDLTKQLEVTLGPDTGDLCLRVGLHSGPVTAGVLRGDKSRFQLFGDTMNTAARVECSSLPNKIHISAETATLLLSAGKRHWVEEREDYVTAKGKGALKTYWLDIRPSSGPSQVSGTNSDVSDDVAVKPSKPLKSVKELSNGLVDDEDGGIRAMMDAKTQRLIDWNVDVLARLLRQIVARRSHSDGKSTANPNVKYTPEDGKMILDEVKEIINLPRSDQKWVSQDQVESIVLSPEVMMQLREYVATIASLYRDNPFHNFEHASHVTMSVVKLLSRIVAPDNVVTEKAEMNEEEMVAMLHDNTYGITSDPLTQFACVYSALIHDVDHTGVPNTQLIQEKAPIAAVYKEKSVAEQNSVEISWELLFDNKFNDLRCAIFANMDECKRFRQLVVNSVMATDIMDKDLKELRNNRWDKAFKAEAAEKEDVRDTVNRKATIVIEHLIQASDVAHTMQHWHIYRKWNERLFMELYAAWKDGRAAKNPAEFWYEGEKGFFDFYIIPLAKKLKTCGVFGVSSDEYLNYAIKNRGEWEARGQEAIESMIQKIIEQEAEEDD